MEPWVAPNAEYAPPKPGEPPLHRAARIGDVISIRQFVEQGADVDGVYDIGLDPGAYPLLATPLMVAAGSGDGASVETVELLLELGADPTLVIDGYTATGFAAAGLGWNYRDGGDVLRLQRLLDAGSPLPPDRERAHRLLYELAGANDTKRLAILLDQGLSANGYWDIAKNREQTRNALADIGLSDASAALIPEGIRDRVMADSQTLLQSPFNMEQAGPYSFQVPIFGAVESGSIECLDLLLRHGADLKVRDSSDRSAMYFASTLPMVEALVTAGVTLEDKDEFGWSPLVNAVSDCDLSRIQALLAAGAAVNATHDHGYTVFMSAVGSERSLPVLNALIKAGADPHAISDYGFNAFHAAIDVNGEANAEESVRQTFFYLKSLGVDIEGRTLGGKTPLSRAICEGTAIEVRVLCELGANPNAVSELRVCGEESCEDMNLPMLFHAVRGSGVGKGLKTTSLLAFGADPLTVDADGHRAVAYAVSQLCAEGDSYENSFKRFFDQAKEFESIKASLPAERGAFIEVATAWFQSFVERFAAEIPLPDSIYADVFRSELIECIAILFAYEYVQAGSA